MTALSAAGRQSTALAFTWENISEANVTYVFSWALGSTPPTSCNEGIIIDPANSPVILNGLQSLESYSVRVCSKNVNGLSSGVTITETTKAVGLSTFQSAFNVIGQPDFETVSQDMASVNMAHFYAYPAGNALIYRQAIFLPDFNNTRILGFNSVPLTITAPNISPDFVLGQNNDLTSTSIWGDGAGQMKVPQSVYALGSKFFVTDYINRVAIFNSIPHGQQNADHVIGQTSFGVSSNNCDASTIYGMEDSFAVGKKLIAADSSRHRVLIWNDWESKGSGSAADMVIGQPNFTSCSSATANPVQGTTYLNNPIGIWSDGTRLAVVDHDNHRVLFWNSFPTADGNGAATAPDFVIGNLNGSSGNTQSTFKRPTYITYDGSYLFIVDSGNHRILVWSTYPQSSSSLPDIVLGQNNFTNKTCNDDLQANDGGCNSPSARTFSFPWGVFSNGKYLVVTDSDNNRYLIFDSTSPLTKVQSITSSDANTTLTIGNIVHIKVTFTDQIQVAGTPQLLIDTSHRRVVNCTSDATDLKSLNCNYTIQAGDAATPLETYGGTRILTNGGSVIDVFGNEVNLNLEGLGDSQALASQNITIY